MITIENIVIRSIIPTSFTVEWDTKQGGTSEIVFSDGSVTNQELFSYFHISTVENLIPGTTYSFRIKSVDRDNGITYSTIQTVETLLQSKWETDVKAARIYQDLPQTYYVKPDGNNSLDGKSITNAWATLTEAVKKVDIGDTILVMPGTWYNQQTAVMTHSGTDFAPITVKSYNPNDKPIFMSATFQNNSLIGTSSVVNGGESTKYYNIGYWIIDGIIVKKHLRPFWIANGGHHIIIQNCEGDGNNSTIFIYSDSHHIVTRNIITRNNNWNAWFCQNSEYPTTGNHHILADGVHIYDQRYHSFFDIHSNYDVTGINQKYITLWNSICDTGHELYGSPAVYVHATQKEDYYISVVNMVAKNAAYAVFCIAEVNGFYADNINVSDYGGIHLQSSYTPSGPGMAGNKVLNVDIRNVTLSLRRIHIPYGINDHGILIDGNEQIDNIKLENINIPTLPLTPYTYFSKQSNVTNLTICNVTGTPNVGTCEPVCKPQLNFLITQV